MIADEEYELLFDDDLPVSPKPVKVGFSLRDYQGEALASIDAGWVNYSRQMAVLATGCGKTVIFSQVAKREVDRGGRVLILAHSDELLEQAKDKLYRSTGLESEKEKADDMAGLTAKVVIGSIQTLARKPYNRLRGFPDNHFTLIIVDECHRTLAKSYLIVLNYFHFGERSLDSDWVAPKPDEKYEHKARVLGVTATADRGDKRSLGEFYQNVAADYDYLKAVQNGYLVRPISKSLPIRLDIRGVHVKKTENGNDFDRMEVAERIRPFLVEIGKHIVKECQDRKLVCFLPSVDTARQLSEVTAGLGMKSWFVSGDCPDRKEKLDAFAKAGRFSMIANAQLLLEGWDVPDVDAVSVLRPTKIRSLYSQAVGRGTRILPGVIDGLEDPIERIEAIASSAKKDLLILDFLWLADRLDLITPVDLVATRPEVRNKMIQENKEGDLIALEGEARDLLESLEKAAKKHSTKSARVIDPLAFAVSVGDTAISTWEPKTQWDKDPPTKGQLDMLKMFGVDTSKIAFKGLASKMIQRCLSRREKNLCSPKKLALLIRLGVPEDQAAMYTNKQADKFLDAKLGQRTAEEALS